MAKGYFESPSQHKPQTKDENPWVTVVAKTKDKSARKGRKPIVKKKGGGAKDRDSQPSPHSPPSPPLPSSKSKLQNLQQVPLGAWGNEQPRQWADGKTNEELQSWGRGIPSQQPQQQPQEPSQEPSQQSSPSAAKATLAQHHDDYHVPEKGGEGKLDEAQQQMKLELLQSGQSEGENEPGALAQRQEGKVEGKITEENDDGASGHEAGDHDKETDEHDSEEKGRRRSRRSDSFIAQNYKTEICQSHKNLGHCEYESNCQFAHGIHELRPRHYGLKYKTQKCINFHTEGYCRFGSRCKFIHDERRLQVKEDEFWLVSPSENLIRIEVVDNDLRKEELKALVEQDGSDDLVDLFNQISFDPEKEDNNPNGRGGSYYPYQQNAEHKTAKMTPGPYYMSHSNGNHHGEMYGVLPYYQPQMITYPPAALPHQGGMMMANSHGYPSQPSGMYSMNQFGMPLGMPQMPFNPGTQQPPMNHHAHVPMNQQRASYGDGYPSNFYGAPYPSAHGGAEGSFRPNPAAQDVPDVSPMAGVMQLPTAA